MANVDRTIPGEFVCYRATTTKAVGVMRYYPHQLSFLIDNPLRKLLITPGTLVFHEHLPDPDLCSLATLKTLADGAGLTFVRQWGHWYNDTAAFEKPLRQHKQI